MTGNKLYRYSVESKTSTSFTGHAYDEWSEFKGSAGGEEISTRECIHCGKTETRLLSQMNVVKIDKVFETFFARFLSIIMSLFSK